MTGAHDEDPLPKNAADVAQASDPTTAASAPEADSDDEDSGILELIDATPTPASWRQAASQHAGSTISHRFPTRG